MKNLLEDVAVLGGLGSLGYGLWLFSPPLVWVLGGVALITWGLGWPRRRTP